MGVVSVSYGCRRGWMAALVGFALTGCGQEGEYAPYAAREVEGRVLLANGKPLTEGRVTFVAKDGLTPPASGDLGPDGRYSLTTRTPGDGAAPGEYKVRIEPGPAPSRSSGAKNRLKYPLKYVDEDSSDLVVTVRPDSGRIEDIRLK